MEGYVYILTHERMPGLVKIGYTDKEVSERLEEINSAPGVPGNFVEFCSFRVFHARKIEKEIHLKLFQYRFLGNKEFFEIRPEVARQYIEGIIKGSDFGVKFDEFTMTECDDMSCLGKTIRRHRKIERITQKELAMVVGCGTRFIVDIENGKQTAQIGKIFSVLRALKLKMVIDFSKKE